MSPPQEIPYRRIGTILVEWRLITENQLATALDEQEQTGRLLGEILVSTYGVSRLDLADALAEQWLEANRAASAALEHDAVQPVVGAGSTDPGAGLEPLEEADLRVLLDEAEAARAELTIRTEELSRRLATLETLVVGVSEALAELRSASNPDRAEAPPTPRRTRTRAGGQSRSRAA